MKKNRIIPVLLLRNGFLVQSREFSRYQNLGNPVTAVRRLSEWSSDELIYLDITRDDVYDMYRDDIRHPNRDNILEIMRDVSKECYMPITMGGKIRSLEDIEHRLKNGADKISTNTKALEDPTFITAAAREFGSQCIIVSMDVKMLDGCYIVMRAGGKYSSPYNAVQWAKMVEEAGAGEILLNSIERDGMGMGYDLKLLQDVSEAVKIPVIALGGVGEWDHFLEAFQTTKVDAVAAANIFHYRDQSVYLARKFLYEHGCNVRRPDLIKV